MDIVDGYIQYEYKEEHVRRFRGYLERNWEYLKPLAMRGIDMNIQGIGTCESNHRLYSYRMKHYGKNWSKAGADSIASVITGLRNGDLAKALNEQIPLVTQNDEKRYKYAVCNALKKSKRQENVAVRHECITMNCPTSSEWEIWSEP